MNRGGGNITDLEVFDLIFACNQIHTREQLKKLQSLTLEQKIQATKVRITEWYEHWQGKVYVSFSGGKDSTVLLDIARSIYPDIEAVFVDTGLEYPEIREFVKRHENVTVLRPKMRFDEVIKKYGYPVASKETSKKIRQIKNPNVGERYRNAMLYGDERGSYGKLAEKWKPLLTAPFDCSEQCCDIMKKAPFHVFEKTSKKHGITAQMAQESRTREKVWVANGCNAFEGRKPISNPMSFWTEQDVLLYIKQKKEMWDSAVVLVMARNKRMRKQARKVLAKEKRRFEICSVYGDIVSSDGDCNYDNTLTPQKLHCTGCQRTGCMFCMFGAHLEKEPNRFQHMKVTHPKQYDYCINQLGLGKVLDYIGVPY